MTNVVKIQHGAKVYVSTATPSDLDDVATYNASATFAHASNAGKYNQAKGILTFGGSPGITREIATASPLDEDVVVKRLVDSKNFGELTMQFLRDDNDDGQAALITASSANSQIVIKVMLDVKSGGAGHEAGDNAIYFRGFCKMDTNPGGANADFNRRDVSIDLTSEPLYADGVNT